MKKFLALCVVAMASLFSTTPALASAVALDYSELTSAITVTDTVAAILSVGAVIVMLTLAVMGVRKIISMVRGA